MSCRQGAEGGSHGTAGGGAGHQVRQAELRVHESGRGASCIDRAVHQIVVVADMYPDLVDVVRDQAVVGHAADGGVDVAVGGADRGPGLAERSAALIVRAQSVRDRLTVVITPEVWAEDAVFACEEVRDSGDALLRQQLPWRRTLRTSPVSHRPCRRRLPWRRWTACWRCPGRRPGARRAGPWRGPPPP